MHQREAESRQRELHIQLLQIQQQVAETTRAAIVRQDTPPVRVPRLQEEKDDIDDYLTQFEQIAEDQEWPRESWAKHLKPQLTGKARAAVNKLDPASSRIYEQVKKTILDAYQLTAEAYRQRFRNVRKKSDETYTQWKVRTVGLFDKWMKAEGVDEDYHRLVRTTATQCPTRNPSVAAQETTRYGGEIGGRSRRVRDSQRTESDVILQSREHSWVDEGAEYL